MAWNYKDNGAPKLSEDFRNNYIVNIKGKDAVTANGLVVLAHDKGIKSLKTTIIQFPNKENDMTCIVQAVIVGYGWNPVTAAIVETEYSAIGDANSKNCAAMVAASYIRMAECVPLSAKILTKDGWKAYDEIKIGDEVLAYDVDSDKCKWTKLQDISVYEGIETVRYSSRSFNAVCTKNHKWAVQYSTPQGINPTKRLLRQADEFKTCDSIIVSAEAEGGNLQLTDDEAEILGWLVCDGSIITTGNSRRCVISQAKDLYMEDLRNLTAPYITKEYISEPYKMTFPNGKEYECKGEHKFNLKAEFSNELLSKIGFTTYKELPKLVTRLSSLARKAMLTGMLKADGTLSKRPTKDVWTFGKKDHEGVMEAFEILATLEGYTLGKPRESSDGSIPVRNIRNRRLVKTSYLEKEDAGVQNVWCPTTEFGTWVMNYKGTISITGNTRAVGRVLRNYTDIGMLCSDEVSSATEEFIPMVTPTQITDIGDVMRKNGITPDEAKAKCKELYHKDGVRSLTEAEAKALIQVLRILVPAV